MKPRIILIVWLTCWIVTSLSAQTIMKVSDQLLSHGNQYEIRGKGMGASRQFYFGSYSMMAAEDEMPSKRKKKKLLNPLKEVNIERNSTFTLVSADHGVAKINVNLSIYRKQRNNKSLVFSEEEKGSFTVENDPDILEHTYQYAAQILSSLDTVQWEMVVIEKIGEEVSGGSIFNGWLTNGERTLQVAPVQGYQPSAKPNLMLVMQQSLNQYKAGFELIEKGVPLAAIQTYFDGSKTHIWLSSALDPKDELMLAAACITLLREAKRRQRAGD